MAVQNEFSVVVPDVPGVVRTSSSSPRADEGNTAQTPNPEAAVNKLDVLGWLLECETSDAQWVFDCVKTQRPALHKSLLQTASEDNTIRDKPFSMPIEPTTKDMVTCEVSDLGILATSFPTNGRFSERLPQFLTESMSASVESETTSLTLALPTNALPLPRNTSGSPSRSTSRIFDEHPTVQFSTFVYYCEEGEGEMIVDVMRIGNLNCESVVQYETQDASAHAGTKYVATFGEVRFPSGSNLQTIKVPLLQNDRWETTLEFVIVLKRSQSVNAILGRYLWRARVKIIDDDAFPTNKFGGQILSGRLDKVPKLSLLYEFIRMSWADSEIRGNLIRIILVDQLNNLVFFFKLFLNVYLVDIVLNQTSDENELYVVKDRVASLFLVTVCMLIPFGVLHIAAFQRVSWSLDACELQKNLLRKFLNYDESSRGKLKQGTLITAMTRDTVRLVEGGTMQLVAGAKATGELVMILLYGLISPIIFDHAEYNVLNFMPLFIFPIILWVFLFLRRKKVSRVISERNEHEDALVDHVHATCKNYRLLADYQRRPLAVEIFERIIQDYTWSSDVADKVFVNNEYFASWVAQFMIAMFIIVAGRDVAVNGAPLGVFLTNLALITNSSNAWVEMCKIRMRMQRVFPALERVVMLMNLPTDVGTRLKLNRRRRNLTSKATQRFRALTPQDDELPLDKLSIKMEDIDFCFERAVGTLCQRINLKIFGTLEIAQGQLVSIVGPKCNGKTTLLKLLGGVLLPPLDSEGIPLGMCYVPSHLRVLHVSHEPMFFHGSLFENLTFGVSESSDRTNHDDASLKRVKVICQSLGLAEDILKIIDCDDHLDLNCVFSQTQLTLLSLARALIANYEVLCIHKPTGPYDEVTAGKLLNLLLQHVRDKGLEQDTDKWHLRRPRTCIYTSARKRGADVADVVFCVSLSDGVRKIDKNDVHEDMLA